MNNTGQATLGYTLQELTRMTIVDLIDPADLEKARAKIKDKVAGQKRTVYELRVRARDGRVLVFDVNSRILMKDGVAVGVQGIARDITQRKNAEEALRLSERQLRTSLEERERLARDLHDGLIQSVYAVGLNVEDCARIAPSDPATVERRLRKAVVDLNHVIRDVRDFIMTLERHRLKGDEFKAALKSLALTAGESQAARIDIAVDDKAATLLNSNEATHLLHIAREALSNAIRHSRAQKISIQLRRGDDGIVFEVADDGIGFNPAACERNGMGLRNMAARAREINAPFRLISQQGEGARIVLDILRQPQGDLRGENPLAHR
jgi:PAS domain S-box-containing protein